MTRKIIESLGWKFTIRGDGQDTFNLNHQLQGWIYCLVWTSKACTLCISSHKIPFSSIKKPSDFGRLFYGNIKTKNELKKLMKQLGII